MNYVGYKDAKVYNFYLLDIIKAVYKPLDRIEEIV
jgi:hypothetical protein